MTVLQLSIGKVPKEVYIYIQVSERCTMIIITTTTTTRTSQYGNRSIPQLYIRGYLPDLFPFEFAKKAKTKQPQQKIQRRR